MHILREANEEPDSLANGGDQETNPCSLKLFKFVVFVSLISVKLQSCREKKKKKKSKHTNS